MTKCQPGMPTGILGPLFSYALTIYTMTPFHSSPDFFYLRETIFTDRAPRYAHKIAANANSSINVQHKLPYPSPSPCLYLEGYVWEIFSRLKI